MDKQGFRSRLEKRGISEQDILNHIGIIEEFESFVVGKCMHTSLESARKLEFLAFSEFLIKDSRNTFDNYLAIARYGNHINNHVLTRSALEMVDGCEALKNLFYKVGQKYGELKRDEVFAGIELPGLGLLARKKASLMRTVIHRMESLLDSTGSQELLSSGLRDLPDDYFQDARRLYLECKDIDEFLERRGTNFISELQSIMESGRLYFTQPITQAVIDFVKSNPEIKQGVRVESIIYEVKIPYMASEYLVETDEKKKRYYYCHCPWVRESLRDDHEKISPIFCNCSAGFHKRFWEVVLDRPLKGWVQESVLNGDARCKLAIQLPAEVIG